MELKYEHLEGRPYVPGTVHCFKLVRDFFSDNFDIAIRDYAFPSDWDADKLNLIEMIHEREGFHKVQDWTVKTLRPADVLCVAVGSSNPNHFVINLGGNKILHHPLYKLSTVDHWRDFWRMATCFVLRHPDVPDLRPELQTVSIQELARARYCPQAEA